MHLTEKFKVGDIILGESPGKDQWAVWSLGRREGGGKTIAIILFGKESSETYGNYPSIEENDVVSDEWTWTKISHVEDLAESVRRVRDGKI